VDSVGVSRWRNIWLQSFLLWRSFLSSRIAAFSYLLLAAVRKRCQSLRRLFLFNFLHNYYRAFVNLECPFMFRICIPTTALNCIIEEVGCYFNVFLDLRGIFIVILSLMRRRESSQLLCRLLKIGSFLGSAHLLLVWCYRLGNDRSIGRNIARRTQTVKRPTESSTKALVAWRSIDYNFLVIHAWSNCWLL
jgi:hypothetical protein